MAISTDAVISEAREGGGEKRRFLLFLYSRMARAGPCEKYRLAVTVLRKWRPHPRRRLTRAFFPSPPRSGGEGRGEGEILRMTWDCSPAPSPFPCLRHGPLPSPAIAGEG